MEQGDDAEQYKSHKEEDQDQGADVEDTDHQGKVQGCPPVYIQPVSMSSPEQPQDPWPEQMTQGNAGVRREPGKVQYDDPPVRRGGLLQRLLDRNQR